MLSVNDYKTTTFNEYIGSVGLDYEVAPKLRVGPEVRVGFVDQESEPNQRYQQALRYRNLNSNDAQQVPKMSHSKSHMQVSVTLTSIKLEKSGVLPYFQWCLGMRLSE